MDSKFTLFYLYFFCFASNKVKDSCIFVGSFCRYEYWQLLPVISFRFVSFEVEVQFWLWDRYLSRLFAVESALEAKQGIRIYFLCLEWAVNGIPWMIGSAASTFYVLGKDVSDEICWYFVVLFVGLCLDLIIVGTAKVVVRRHRPTYNKPDQKFIIHAFDDYSFPSGDVSRATFLALFGLYYCNFPWLIQNFLRVVPLVIGLSRVIMGRHYIFDVVGGVVFGIFVNYVAGKLPFDAVPFLKNIIFGFNSSVQTSA